MDYVRLSVVQYKNAVWWLTEEQLETQYVKFFVRLRVVTQRIIHDVVLRMFSDKICQRLYGKTTDELTTTVAKLGPFYRAEEYHQQYVVESPGAD